MILPVGGQIKQSESVRAPEETIAPESVVSLFDLEKKYILMALRAFKGNKYQAAFALGISVKTLYNKLHVYGEFDNFKFCKEQNDGTTALANG